MNDSSAAIRSEAFKAALNLQLLGGGDQTLRFVRTSLHADIRREVLTEVIAGITEPWAWDLLLEGFNDPDPSLRDDAFTTAQKKTKGLEVLEAALGSRYPDLRSKAVAGLVKKHSAAAQSLLLNALGDEDREVRLQAIDALVSDDAPTALASALTSPHADVRVRAASALARHGDRAALGPLVMLAAAPEPAEADRRESWLELAAAALDGLAELGDPEAVLPVLPMLDSPHAMLRKGAARVLCWCAVPDSMGTLQEALSHNDPNVKYQAAMGLALLGVASIAPLIDSAEAAKFLSRDDRLAVVAALGDSAENRLVLTLDIDDEAVRDRALLLLILRELKAPSPEAARLIAALSSRSPRVRLLAADALRSAHDPARLLETATRLINDRGEESNWTIPESTIDTLADSLVLASASVRARGSAQLLPLLDPVVKESKAFELAFSAFTRRFATEMEKVKSSKPIQRDSTSTDEFMNRAFGAYVGLAREQGSRPASQGKKRRAPGSDVQVRPMKEHVRSRDQADQAPSGNDPATAARVRRSAIDRLRSLVDADPSLVGAVVPVFVQALGDPNQHVRLGAFDHLVGLGADPTVIGAEAIAAGHTDVGVRGLELLSGSAGDVERGQSLLEQVMMTRKDDLAVEAARLLGDRLGRSAVATKALEASFERLRLIGVSWLSESTTDDKSARCAFKAHLNPDTQPSDEPPRSPWPERRMRQPSTAWFSY